MVRLGDRVKDEISGFTGIVTGRFEYLYGCVRAFVQPEKMDKGKLLDGNTFDEDQLIVVKAAVREGVPPKSKVPTGGPRSLREVAGERR